MATQNVRFVFTDSKKRFDALAQKDSYALYFITDAETNENYLYMGEKLLAMGHIATDITAGLMSPEDKAKLNKLDGSSTGEPSTEIMEAIEAINAALADKADTDGVYSKSEVDVMHLAIEEKMATPETIAEIQTKVESMETKVEASTTDVTEIQKAVAEKVDAATVEEIINEKLKETPVSGIDDGEI